MQSACCLQRVLDVVGHACLEVFLSVSILLVHCSDLGGDVVFCCLQGVFHGVCDVVYVVVFCVIVYGGCSECSEDVAVCDGGGFVCDEGVFYGLLVYRLSGEWDVGVEGGVLSFLDSDDDVFIGAHGHVGSVDGDCVVLPPCDEASWCEVVVLEGVGEVGDVAVCAEDGEVSSSSEYSVPFCCPCVEFSEELFVGVGVP